MSVGMPAKSTLLLVMAVCVSCSWSPLVTRIPSRSVTVGSTHETVARIRLYHDMYGALPESLDQLPTRDGYANDAIDGLGRQLIYSRTKETATVESLGADGKLGGTGEDADYRVKVLVKPDGELKTVEELPAFPK